ncbi:MAG: thioredoxin domain-containing protein [bacterium]
MAKKVESKGRGTAGRPSVVRAAKRGGPGQKFWIALGALAIAGIGAVSWAANRPKAAPVAFDPNLKAKGYLLGNASAPVEIIQYADFECPSCGQYATVTEPDVRTRLVNTGKVRIKYLDFPLAMHPNTWDASLAASCANDQGKFWEMHDLIFANQDRWNGEATKKPRKPLGTIAQGLGLDMTKYDACMDAETHRAQIQANEAEGERRGISQTPSFVIGGQLYPGALSFDALNKIVEAELAKPRKAASQADSSAPTAPGDAKKGASLTPTTKSK